MSQVQTPSDAQRKQRDQQAFENHLNAVLAAWVSELSDTPVENMEHVTTEQDVHGNITIKVTLIE